MPQDAPPNGSARVPSWDRVAGMQAKLHRWAAADPGRRFDDLFNLAHDPATLLIAFCRVAGNQGANTPGVDGVTADYVTEQVGVPGFLDDLRAALKDGSFRPLPVRERMIPKPGGSGKLRRLGIPAIADRVVQAALKLVLEPVFEADFEPVSYGFRPKRRAQDAIAETFRGPGQDPTVLSVGQEPKRMRPLGSVIRGGGYLPAVRAMIDEVAATGRPVRRTTRDGRRQLIGEPLTSFRGHVHGVYVFYGPVGEEPPPRPMAGAWYFNLTTNAIGGSDDLLDLYGEPTEKRHQERFTAEAFGRLSPAADEPGALAMIVRAKPGTEYQGRRWTVRRDDGETIFVNLWCRAVAEAGEGGREEVVIRSITQAIGPVAAAPDAPAPLVTIEQRVVAAEYRPGWHRAIVDHGSLSLVRWLDPPMPGIAWEIDAPHRPAIHRADLRRAREMSARLATSSHVEGVLRLRTTEGGWQAVQVAASPMLLDQHTTAALVTLSAPSRGDQG